MRLDTSPFSRSRSTTSTLCEGTSRRMSQHRWVAIVVVPTPPFEPATATTVARPRTLPSPAPVLASNVPMCRDHSSALTTRCCTSA